MLLSVILTTYQRPHLLPRAVRSVLSQCLPADVSMELLVTDDDPLGSGLGGMNLDHLSVASSVTVKYLKRSEGTSGVAASRNRALAMALGEWFLFLDDDDVLLEGALDGLLARARSEGADFCAGGYEVLRVDAYEAVIEKTSFQSRWNSFDQLLLSNLFPIGSFIIRRDVVRVLFNVNLKSHEDWLFLLDNLCHATVTLLSQPVLHVFQVSDGSHQHRNEIGGNAQRAADYARIYSLHPARHLVKLRKAILAGYGYPHLDALIGAAAADCRAEPYFHETPIGSFMICNPQETIQAALLLEGHFEPLAAKIAIMVGARLPGLIVDIGANMGVFSVPVARALPQRSVISIEPQRMVFMQLCANLLVNRLSNVRPFNLAVGLNADRGDSIDVPFFDIFSERYTGSVSLDYDTQRIRAGIPDVAEPSQWAVAYDCVSFRSLEQIVQGQNVSFIKIDVEGMELQVLRSCENTLRSQTPFLFFEAWSFSQFESQRNELLVYVLGLGYKLLRIQEDYFAYHLNIISQDDILLELGKIGLKLDI